MRGLPDPAALASRLRGVSRDEDRGRDSSGGGTARVRGRGAARHAGFVAGVELEPLLEAVRTALQDEPGIAASFVFGSHARGRARPGSDIDVAVLPDKTEQADRLALRRRMMAALGKHLAADRIDLVLLDEAPPVLAFAVLKHGRLALCRDEVALHRYRVAVYRQHADYEPVERFFREVTRERAKPRTSRG